MLRCHREEGEEESPGEHIEHLVRPLSAGFAVPLFALFSAGVAVSGDALGKVFTQPETLGVVLGLVVGKTLGIFGGTWLTSRFTRASLSDDLAWADVFAVASLAGIGFTVSLLIGELAFEDDATMAGSVKAAVLTGSLLATVLATVLLKIRNAKYRKLAEAEERDEDLDGVPDVYEQDDPEYHVRMAEILEKKAAEHRRLAREKAAARDALAQVPGGAGDRDDGPA
jgi:NhaA family Na+:H+ antiporter